MSAVTERDADDLRGRARVRVHRRARSRYGAKKEG